MSGAALDLSILAPAFIAGMLVLATHVPLGMQVLARGIVFIDLAIAQIAGLGVIAADSMGWEPQGLAVQAAAVGAALLGGLVLAHTEKHWPETQEALIGVMFVLAASGGILFVAGNPHGGEHLVDLLAGQILWVGYAQLLPAAAATAAIAALWFFRREKPAGSGFYALFAVAVTVSVQLVGIYLVFASLIIPALATRRCPPRNRMARAFLIGTAGYGTGLALSAWLDLPSGAVIVWVMALIGAVVYGWGSRKSGASPTAEAP